MKLVTFILNADETKRQFVGALIENDTKVLDLQRAASTVNAKASRYFESMIDFLSGMADARELAAELIQKSEDDCKISISDVQLLAPVPNPPTLRDTACHEAHLIGCNRRAVIMKGTDISTVDPETFKPGQSWYEEPRFYKGNVHTIIGTGVDVAFPEQENFKDYELELAFYICKEGKNISHRDAMDYVGGYTIFNDFSARMMQLREMDPGLNVGPGRSKDFANAMGPCMVTPDAFDYENAKMIVRVNGEVRGQGNHGECYHKIPDIIEYISYNTTLYPGDIIATGTVGTGAGIETGIPLRVDDVVELEIEGIGKLVNKIVTPPACKFKNTAQRNKRYVCGPVNGKSMFVIDDYPDTWRTLPGNKPILDVWRVNEMPAKASATAAVDMGNLPIEHEPVAGSGNFIFRHVPFNFPMESPRLSELPPPTRKFMMDMLVELHKLIGTKHIPSEEDMQKHATMHRTETLNMLFCAEGDLVSLNDLEDAYLRPGDALIQPAGMHGYKGFGTTSGLLIAADMSTYTQLSEKPKAVMTSKLKRFKRFVTGTMKSESKASGMSDNLLDDYSPNESEIYDKTGKMIGYAGDLWHTFAPNADVSGAVDAVTKPMQEKPPKNGITYRMVDLLPGCVYESDESFLNFFSVITGQLDAVCEEKRVTVPMTGDVIQLKGAAMHLENTSDGITRFARFMIDAE